MGLVGANGASKTTLMKVILGFSHYQSGTYEITENKNTQSNTGALIESPGLYPLCQATIILNYLMNLKIRML